MNPSKSIKKYIWYVLVSVTIVSAVVGYFLVFKKPAYKINFYVDNAIYHSINLDNKTEITMPANPEKQNYVFNGWFYDNETWEYPFIESDFDKSNIKNDISLYAKFTQLYSITFYSNGEQYSTLQTLGNETLTLPANPEKTGYTFDGWFVDNNQWTIPFTASTYENNALTGNISVYAKFTEIPLQYTITFYVNGIEYSNLETPGNEILTMPINPSVTDYTFDGWYFDNNQWTIPFTANTYENSIPTTNISVYAKLTKIQQQYTITFYSNGEQYTTVQTAGNEVISLPLNPEKSGYIFDGWFMDNNEWNTPFSENTYANSVPIKNISVYAKFKQLFTITFYSNGEQYATVQTAGNEVISLPLNPEKSGYTFDGWFTDNNQWKSPFLANIFANSVPANNVDVYAKFKQLYNITFYVNSEVFTTIQTVGNEIISLPANPEVSGYVFDGWFMDNNQWNMPFEANMFASSVPAGNIEVYANLKQLFNITFYVNSEQYATVKTVGNQIISLPVNPEISGYVFDGWFMDNNQWNTPFEANMFANTSLAEDVSVYAKFSQLYSITFYVNSEEYVVVKTVGNEVVTLPANPEVSGYAFDGWFMDNNEWNTPFDANIFENSIPTANINVYAKLTQVYSITFYVFGEQYAVVKTKGNEVISLPENPKQTGYIFDGWFMDNSEWNTAFTANMFESSVPQSDIDVYAKLTQVYSIIFYVDNEVYSTITTQGNEVLTMPANPELLGSTFDGWFMDKNVWNIPFTANTYENSALTTNVSVYAKFTVIPQVYNITLYVDGQVYATLQTEGNEVLTMPADPEKSGYKFHGWFQDEGEWTIPLTSNTFETSIPVRDINAYAKLNQVFNITFYADGEVYATLQTEGNEVLTMPADPEKTGYAFDGWFLDNNEWKTLFTSNIFESSIPESDLSVYAKQDLYESNLEFALAETEDYYIVQSRGECTAENIIIPEMYENLPVKEIAKSAFYQDETIKRLIISKNIEVINDWAFSWCSALLEVKFEQNSNIKTLGSYIFNCSKALTTANIPAGLTEIPDRLFANCESLVNLTIEQPEIITVIGAYAFYGTLLTEFNDFVKLEVIEEHAFANCSKLVSFYFPKSIKSLGSGAFNDTRAYHKKIYIEDINNWCSVDVDGVWALPWLFHGTAYHPNGEIIKEIIIPEGITTIKKHTYYGCRLVETIIIPESVTTVEYEAFFDVLYCKKLVINANITNLGDWAFWNVGKYTLTQFHPTWKPPEGYQDVQVTFGENVTIIPSGLFYNVDYPPYIGRITFTSLTPPTFEKNWLTVLSVFKEILVPEASIEEYKTALGTKLAEYVVGY